MDLTPLVDRLHQFHGLDRRRAAHLLDEVMAYFDEPVDVYVQRRHRDLKREGLKNDARSDGTGSGIL